MRIHVKDVKEATSVVQQMAHRRTEDGKGIMYTDLISPNTYVLSRGQISFHDYGDLLGTASYKPLEGEEQGGILQIKEKKRKSLLPYLQENLQIEGLHIFGLKVRLP